jgi:hypothetical protein
MFNKQKSKNTTEKKRTTNVTAEDFDVQTMRLNLVREELTFPASLIGDGELRLMLKMDTKTRVIKGIMGNRFRVAIAAVLFGLIFGMISKKYFILMLFLGILIAAVSWNDSIKKTKKYYQIYSINRQVAFTEFTKIAGALLPELDNGKNLLSIFEEVSKHMDNENDRKALKQLMTHMQSNNESSQPFLDFAHQFSTSDRAELTMLYMHQMYLGNTDTSGIQSLINDSNEDYQAQTEKIITTKIKRFYSTATKIAMSVSIVVFGYFGIYIVNMFQHIFKIMSNVKF